MTPRQEVLEMLFKSAERAPGYPSIVKTLVSTGQCHTTIDASNLDFGQASQYISWAPIPDTEGPILMKFDSAPAEASEAFHDMADKVLREKSAKVLEAAEALSRAEKEFQAYREAFSGAPVA